MATIFTQEYFEKAAREKEAFETQWNNPALRAGMYQSMMDSADGVVKEATEAASTAIRYKLREAAISPAILPYEMVTDGMLMTRLDTDDPTIYGEIEGEIAAPVSIGWSDTGYFQDYKINKFAVEFLTNATPEFTKNIHKLRTYRADVRQLTLDNSLKDLERVKDVLFFQAVDTICGNRVGAINPATGQQQYVEYPGRLTRDNLISSKQLLPGHLVTDGVFVVNTQSWADIERWNRNEMGGDFSEKLAINGAKAWKGNGTEFSGINFITPMKRDIVGTGIMYQFSEPSFLGRAYVLEKPTLYVEKKKDIITFSAREVIGVTIANQRAVQKVGFSELLKPFGGDGRLTTAP